MVFKDFLIQSIIDLEIKVKKMKIITLQHIPLASAYLCPNCSCIGNSSKQCPACASSFLLSVANVLDREPAEDAQISYERGPALAA